MEVILLLLGVAALVFLVLWIRGSHPAESDAGGWYAKKRLWIVVSAASAVFFLVYSYRG